MRVISVLGLIVACVLNCVPASARAQLLTNPGMEGSYNSTASNWWNDAWNNPSYRCSPDSNIVHGGARSQKIELKSLPPNAGLLFRQNYRFVKGHVYRGSVWLRSSDHVTVQFVLRQSGFPYQAYASKMVQVGDNWRKITIEGGLDSDMDGLFGVWFRTTGTLWLDDASLTDITANTTAVATENVIPSSYFGVHLNKYLAYNTFPSIDPGMIRLWDCGTRWNEIEPAAPVNGVHRFKFDLMDTLVKTALDHGAKVIYTMGQTPHWACARPNEAGDNYGPGTAAEPADLSSWESYVRTVARRYKGKIHYYEIWNEANIGQNFSGTPEAMVKLAQAAYPIIKSIDRDAIILSPSTTVTGLSWFDEYLFRGGRQFGDYISWHRYVGLTPEDVLPQIDGVRSVMNNYGIGSEPLFNTEGATGDLPAGTILSDDQARGCVARLFITMWASGIGNFNWYCWDLNVSSVALSQSGYKTPTPAGIAFREVKEWLTGARMVSKSIDKNQRWIVKIQRGKAYSGWLVWNAGGQTSEFVIPASWAIVRRRDLDGTQAPLTGVRTTTIGTAPILLENGGRIP